MYNLQIERKSRLEYKYGYKYKKNIYVNTFIYLFPL